MPVVIHTIATCSWGCKDWQHSWAIQQVTLPGLAGHGCNLFLFCAVMLLSVIWTQCSLHTGPDSPVTTVITSTAAGHTGCALVCAVRHSAAVRAGELGSCWSVGMTMAASCWSTLLQVSATCVLPWPGTNLGCPETLTACVCYGM